MSMPGFAAAQRAAAAEPHAAPRRGLWVTFLSPFGLELAAGTGPEWIGLDLQHGDVEPRDLAPLLRVASLAGLPTLARLSSHDPTGLARALETGVDGLIVPTVESAEQAAALAAAAHLPPRGRRSSGLSRAGLEPIGGSPGGPAEEPLLLAMVETGEGVSAAEEIASTPGVDGIFVGPYDLALSLGEQSPTAAPVVEAIRSVFEATTGQQRITGLFAGDPRLEAVLPDVHLLAVDTDASALRHGLGALYGPGGPAPVR